MKLKWTKSMQGSLNKLLQDLQKLKQTLQHGLESKKQPLVNSK
jgi:hypothetical protein